MLWEVKFESLDTLLSSQTCKKRGPLVGNFNNSQPSPSQENSFAQEKNRNKLYAIMAQRRVPLDLLKIGPNTPSAFVVFLYKETYGPLECNVTTGCKNIPYWIVVIAEFSINLHFCKTFISKGPTLRFWRAFSGCWVFRLGGNKHARKRSKKSLPSAHKKAVFENIT